MNITPKSVTIRELTEGYNSSLEGGIIGYGGRLNIRPAFQREFVYSVSQCTEVIKSVMNGYPLGVMYWLDKGNDTFEMLDGQQRTLSICNYVCGNMGYNMDYFRSLPCDKKEAIMNYRLMVYTCTGEESEIVDWFRIVNIYGEKLTDQEILNAAYTGRWLDDAKRLFSKKDCDAQKISADYMKGSPIRQEYLETAIRWIAVHDDLKGKNIVRDYMSQHRQDTNCNAMWLYFQSVINWAKTLFPKPDKYAKGIDWGKYYEAYHNRDYDAGELYERFRELMNDDDVTRIAGIYEYLIDGDERHLNLRKFRDKDKAAAYMRQKGLCEHCGKKCEIWEMEADHITPWSLGGHTTPENCQLLCKECNRKKSNK